MKSGASSEDCSAAGWSANGPLDENGRRHKAAKTTTPSAVAEGWRRAHSNKLFLESFSGNRSSCIRVTPCHVDRHRAVMALVYGTSKVWMLKVKPTLPFG